MLVPSALVHGAIVDVRSLVRKSPIVESAFRDC